MSPYKRDHPRTAAELLVRIRLADGTLIHATTANLSRAGFQIAADPQTVGLLFPASHQPVPRERIETHTELHIPGRGGNPITVEAGCAAVFARRIAAQRYRVGFQFTSLAPDVEELLGEFVDAR